jgi:hypothetical protein
MLINGKVILGKRIGPVFYEAPGHPVVFTVRGEFAEAFAAVPAPSGSSPFSRGTDEAAAILSSNAMATSAALP